MSLRPVQSEDIVRWADGTWCYWEELEEMSHMSDDFEVIPTESPEWELIATIG